MFEEQKIMNELVRGERFVLLSEQRQSVCTLYKMRKEKKSTLIALHSGLQNLLHMKPNWPECKVGVAPWDQWCLRTGGRTKNSLVTSVGGAKNVFQEEKQSDAEWSHFVSSELTPLLLLLSRSS